MVAARSSTELDAEAATDEEDENMEAGGDADQDSINDGDAEEDDNVEDVKPELYVSKKFLFKFLACFFGLFLFKFCLAARKFFLTK